MNNPFGSKNHTIFYEDATKAQEDHEEDATKTQDTEKGQDTEDVTKAENT